MKLTKQQRDTLKMMFGGRCAYCGCVLGDKWHADHVEALQRKSTYMRGKGFVATGEAWNPSANRADNLMPACVPCNIDKADCSIDSWRNSIARRVDVLTRNSTAYRHARRFGLVEETGKPVVFYFERSADKEPHNTRIQRPGTGPLE